jgi:hypothetical protein
MYYKLCLAILFYSCFGCITTSKSAKYQIGGTNWPNGEFYLLDARGDTIKKLEKHEYQIGFTGDFDKFAVFGIKGERDWCAIDIHENILFKIGNFPLEELWSPDNFVEDRIRIIDESHKYGFANTKGKIVIKPKYELVTQFNNGFAIILEDCHKVYWKDDEETDDEDTDHEEHRDCNHYSIECNKHGYINKKGKIIKLGYYTFEEIQKEIGWEWE